ncbi:50S ribosomal protein L25 [Gemmatimonadota bacterium]
MTVPTTLKAETRESRGKNEMRRLRKTGRIPGVVYGPSDEPIPVSLDQKEVSHLLQSVTVENTVIELSVSGSVKKSYQTLIREIQRHPFKPEIRHLDFYCLGQDRTVTLQVPIVLHGSAAGVRNQGGLVQHVLRDLDISVLPSNIPDQIVVDITELEIGQSIHVEDLEIGDYELLTDPKSTVLSIIPPTVIKEPEEEELEGEEIEGEEEEGVAVEEEADEPEVIGRREKERDKQ